MIFLALIVLIPIFSVISLSLASAAEIAENRNMIFPKKIDFSAYETLFRSKDLILNGYKITFFRVIVGTALNLTASYFVGYALAKRDLPGRSGITFFFFFTMLFGGGLIPTYMVIKNTGLINTIWVYIIPGIMSVWNMLLVRNFILGIPESLFESARIDGAGELVVIFRIVLPLSTASLVTIGLFYAVDHWNAWWDAYLYVSKTELQPVQLLLRNILAQANLQVRSAATASILSRVKVPARSLQNAAVIVTTLPILLLYPFLQKYFVKGVMIGAIKG
jgi:putative aldouronate transport system permease protein